jgi:hypothetical protein
LATICLGYLALMPLGIVRYARIKRQRVAAQGPQAERKVEPFDVTHVPD